MISMVQPQTASIQTDAATPIWPAWLPLAILPAAVGWLAVEWPSWVFMWALAVAIYAGLKWLSVANAVSVVATHVGRVIGYLLLWPGMDAKAFFDSSGCSDRPGPREGLLALAKLICGVLGIVVADLLVDQSPRLAGWVGMIGVVIALHFGLFHLLSIGWRCAGVDAPPIMNAPLRSSSLSDFWGRRWNRAFRDLGHAFVFQPLHRHLGPAGATMTVFLVSGVVHDLVISVPAHGGWGRPTLYFVFQGIAILLERSPIGTRLGLRRGMPGRLWAAAVIILPLPLLFHRAFVERVVVPMLSALGAMQ